MAGGGEQQLLVRQNETEDNLTDLWVFSSKLISRRLARALLLKIGKWKKGRGRGHLVILLENYYKN